jgi:hypothetical protein
MSAYGTFAIPISTTYEPSFAARDRDRNLSTLFGLSGLP